MPIYKLEELNYQELEKMNPARTVFFLVISPLEEHAPHLPVGTDIYIAQYFAQQSAEELTQNRLEWNVILAQPIPMGASVFKFKGSVRHSIRTVYDVILGYGKAIAQWGFKHLVMISSHGGAGHIAVLEEAAVKISKKYQIRAISLSGVIVVNFLLGKYTEPIQNTLYRRLGQEDLKNLKYDYHAGWWETSLMLLLRPELVKEKYKELPPVLIENPLQLRADAALKLGKGLGYFGTPSFADVKLAEASSKVLLSEGMKIIYRFLDGEDVSKQTQSIFYRSFLFRRNLHRYIFLFIFIILAVLFHFLFKVL